MKEQNLTLLQTEIEEVRKTWLEQAYLDDCEIPLPRKFSGTISLRMPCVSFAIAICHKS